MLPADKALWRFSLGARTGEDTYPYMPMPVPMSRANDTCDTCHQRHGTRVTKGMEHVSPKAWNMCHPGMRYDAHLVSHISLLTGAFLAASSVLVEVTQNNQSYTANGIGVMLKSETS